MISVCEAQEFILSQVSVQAAETLELGEALGRFVAEPIFAAMDSPLFSNSAMDGYALKAEDTVNASGESPLLFPVFGTISAGTQSKKILQPGEATRIFTGAMIPEGATAVVKQEDVVKKADGIVLTKPVAAGENIRKQGEEFRVGKRVLGRGEPLNPATLALLAGLGTQEIPVFSCPRVGILVTGSEIVPVGSLLDPGQIYDSNSYALRAALQEMHLQPVGISHCRDQKNELAWAIASGLQNCDFLIVTGGVSVGDFDLVKEVAAAEGVKEIFWKVKQKPGKPLFFGKKGEKKFLFGLPGNPASALVCFYEYVRVALLKAMGSLNPFLPRVWVPIHESFKKKSGLLHFLRGYLSNPGDRSQVQILQQQGSHILNSFAQGNCLVILPEAAESLEAGTPVEVHLLPGIHQNPGGGLK